MSENAWTLAEAADSWHYACLEAREERDTARAENERLKAEVRLWRAKATRNENDVGAINAYERINELEAALKRIGQHATDFRFKEGTAAGLTAQLVISNCESWAWYPLRPKEP